MTPEYKAPHYDRLKTVAMDDVLPLIGANMTAPVKGERVDVAGAMVHVTSLRLRTFFTKGTACLVCGLPAQYFAVERDTHKADTTSPYHLNLWGVNAEGAEVIFTHDHILARALGGGDVIDNTRTACGPCNWEKSLIESELAKTDPVAIALRAQKKAERNKGKK